MCEFERSHAEQNVSSGDTIAREKIKDAEQFGGLFLEYFNQIDTDGSGNINRAELDAAVGDQRKSESYRQVAAFALEEFEVISEMAESSTVGGRHVSEFPAFSDATRRWHGQLLVDHDLLAIGRTQNHSRHVRMDLSNVITKRDLSALMTVSTPERIDAAIQQVREDEDRLGKNIMLMGAATIAMSALGAIHLIGFGAPGPFILAALSSVGMVAGATAPPLLLWGAAQSRSSGWSDLRSELYERNKMLASWKFE